ncbi:MAG: bifunctional phosphopantothenoylcysteine decarboxylase/phosphopantothenate--cysteine ligase CoaBC [Vulcanimicrobiaceae bacterium]
MISGRRILLGVTGGIAAYKAAAFCSTLVQRGAIVDVMMTANAERFVGSLTFASLTARPVYTALWDAPERIPHIRLVREADAILVAPATANFIGKLANGVADDLLSSALLAARVPIVLAPAMNSAMLAHDETQSNLARLRERGYSIVEPEAGFLAERERGVGRLASEERMLAGIERAVYPMNAYRGKRVLITAGPTREAFDPIRFISNASTGTMGIALAREAWVRGADVTLLLGPTNLHPLPEVRTRRFTTAAELLELATEEALQHDVVFATAAVADWRPDHYSASKKKKSGDEHVTLIRTPDVLAKLGQEKQRQILVGFAAETNDHEANAREKLQRKHLDAIVVNDVRDERGFGPGENTLTLISGDGEQQLLGTADKATLSARLLDAVAPLVEGLV